MFVASIQVYMPGTYPLISEAKNDNILSIYSRDMIIDGHKNNQKQLIKGFLQKFFL
jgi:hypothetical protein